MSKAERKHYVTFLSPGTMMSESTTKPIERHDPKLVVAMAEQIVERYGAKPYGFRFETRIVGSMPDGEGGTLTAQRDVGVSGIHFLGGKLETYEEVLARNHPDERILRENMRSNEYWIVCVNTNSFRSVLPFEEGDRLVDATGEIVERGEDPKHVAYRKTARAKFGYVAPTPQSSTGTEDSNG